MTNINNIPPFPPVWDSVIRSSFVACPLQCFWAHMEHLIEPKKSIDLFFGGVLATGIEMMRKAYYQYQCSIDEALCIGHANMIKEWGDVEFDYDRLRADRNYKSLPAAHDALEAYAERWPFEHDQLKPFEINGELMIEKTFAIPIPNTAHPVTSEPILYAGRCDMIADWKETGTVFIDDDKSTKSLGKRWRQQWRLRGQFTGYVRGVRSFGIKANGVIVRGMGILSNEVKTDEVIEMRPDWMVERWERQVSRDVNRAAGLWKRMAENPESPPWDMWDQAFDSACTQYSGCSFNPLCQSEHPERWFGEYERREWNPLQRGNDE